MNAQAARRRARCTVLKEELLSLAEPDYARFAASLLRKPSEKEPSGTAANLLGVRLPVLRKLAGRLTKQDWRENLEALSAHVQAVSEKKDDGEDGKICFEEVMLWGFLAGNGKIGRDLTLQEQFAFIRSFIPYIDNWSLCDSFCAGLKFAREFPEQTWEFLQPYFGDGQEYAVRFGVVMALTYFVTEHYVDALFQIFDAVRHEGYYAKMAVAWAVSVCYVKFPEKTTRYLDDNRLEDFTYNKALRKITESRCVTKEVREEMRKRCR